MLGIKEDCVKVVDDKGCYDSVIFVGDSIFAVGITDDKGTLVMADDLSFRFDIREYLPDFYKGEKPGFKIRYNIEISGAIRIGHMTYILKSDSERFIVIDFCNNEFLFSGYKYKRGLLGGFTLYGGIQDAFYKNNVIKYLRKREK